MKKYRHIYEPDTISMPSFDTGSLFLDIETTGFQRTSTYLTIIGLAWMEHGQIIIEQWLNETGRQEEPLLLLELERFLKEQKRIQNLLHYNGTTFDLPYLKSKYEQFHLPTSLPELDSLDLYHLAKKYRTLLSLEGLKQKNLEECFGLFREDKLSGQELIDVYLEGIHSKDRQLLNAYLLHNKEDMEGMVFLQNLIKLNQIIEGNFIIEQWEETKDGSSLSIKLAGDFYLYHSISVSYKQIHFSFRKNSIEIRLPIQHMEARYYYENYKDYYYLPAEDCAMHKSVAAYVEKEYRIKATKETCYTKKTAAFLPLPLPASTRSRKAVIKECCSLNLFYQCYGDCTAWVLKDPADECKKKLYLKHLIQTCIFL